MRAAPFSCPSCGASLHDSAVAQGLCVSCLLGSPALASAGTNRLPSGAWLGPYEIGHALGRGGMGEVYEGWDARLQRRVAIKVLPSRLAADPRLSERLEREARIVASLNHRHICAVHDVGREDDVSYVVMEMLDGETLADRLAGGALPIAEVVRRAIEIADALDRAHRQGITHGDLKPSNIMLTASGVKLLDFGLAALCDGEEEDGANSGTRTAGVGLVGTVPYMAPEQLDGEPADHLSDVFAFGLVLYEMLTARPAFSGTTQARQILAVLSADPVPPSTLRHETPATLDRLVRRCLRKDREERWQSMRDLRFELQSLNDHPRHHVARGRAPAWHARAAWAAAGVALAVVALAAFVPFARPAPPGGPAAVVRFTAAVPSYPQAPVASGLAFVSPDGSTLAWVLTGRDGRTMLATRRFDTNETTHIATTDGVRWPFWSPDSRSLAFFERGQLKRVSAAGGPVGVIAPAPHGQGGAWGPDGTILFAADSGGPLYRVPATGGDPSPVTTLDDTRGELSHEWPVFLPDGRHFVYFAASSHEEQSGLYVAELGSGVRRWLCPSDGAAAYAPPGYLLFTRSSMLVAQRLNTALAHLTGEPIRVTARTYTSEGIAPPSFSVSTTGVLVYQVPGFPPGHLTWFNRSGRELERPLDAGSYFNPTVSHDGQQLAIDRQDPDTWLTAIWRLDLRRRVLSRLTGDQAQARFAIWSPDDRDVVFVSNLDARYSIYRMKVDGGEPVWLFTTTKAVEPTDWSLDGASLLLQVREEETGDDIWVLPTTEGAQPKPYLQSRFNERQARLSPDGRWVAFTSDESGNREVYVQSFPSPGIKSQISTGGGSAPAWREDGRELFYLAADRRLMAVAIVTGSKFGAGASAELFRVPGDLAADTRGPYSVTADGQRFLINLVAQDGLKAPAIRSEVVLNWLATIPPDRRNP